MLLTQKNIGTLHFYRVDRVSISSIGLIFMNEELSSGIGITTDKLSKEMMDAHSFNIRYREESSS